MTAASALEGYWEIEAGDVPEVEKALVRLRKEYASAEAVQEGHAGTRNSVANLVIYAGSEADAAHATATMQELAGRHPARTILLVADLEPGAPGVKASVSASCTVGHNGLRLCYEEIRLRASGRSGPHLRSIVDPLLISDLPVFLWWTGDPPLREPVFLTLAKLSSRVLVDSARFRAPGVAFERLARLARAPETAVTVGDLNWNRLQGWRNLLAQLFDPPAMLDLLPHIRRVNVDFAVSGAQTQPASAQALLLTGWLADRLDWQTDRPAEQTFSGSQRLRLRGTSEEVLLELRSHQREETPPGTVRSVRIDADDGTHRAVISVTHAIGISEGHAYTSVSLDSAPPVERAIRFVVDTDPVLISQQLETLERDTVFEHAAEAAASLAALMPEADT